MLPGICLAAFLCCSCGVETPPEIPEDSAHKTPARAISMESVPVLDYVMPQHVPNVLVSLAGYEADGKKYAAVRGRRVPKRFQLVDAETGETVFTGNLEEEEHNREQDCYTAYADFSDWTREGNYYLECEYVGRSYSFSIEDELYGKLFEEAGGKLLRDCEEKTVSLSDVRELLTAYEWYPDIFPDGNGNQIPDVLDKIAAWISATAGDGVESGQEALYAGTLAKFSYLYQKFNRQYATDCLKHASVVYEQKQSGMQKDAECFFALSEMFRATGLSVYNNQIVEFKTYFKSHVNFAEEEGYLFGAMTYIATRQKVDVELCEIFVKTIMDEGEELSDIYTEMIHPVNAHNNGEKDLLRHAMDIACSNYVMNNYHYNQVVEEFWQYLRGKNAQSVDFYSESTADSAEGYFLLLAQLTAVQERLKE